MITEEELEASAACTESNQEIFTSHSLIEGSLKVRQLAIPSYVIIAKITSLN